MDVPTQHLHAHDERNDETVSAIVCPDLTIAMRTQHVRETGWTYCAKLVLEVVASVRDKGTWSKSNHIYQNQRLSTIFPGGASDGFLAERKLRPEVSKSTTPSKSRLWREDVVDAIEERIKVRNLKRCW